MKSGFAPALAARSALKAASEGRRLVVWALFGAALVAAVAFATYVPAGFSGFEDASANLAGAPGRGLAFLVVEPFGLGAFGLPFFLVFLGWRLRTRPPVSDPLLKVLGLPMLLFTLGLLAELALPGRRLARTQFPLGGVLGERCAVLLADHFGLAWSLVAAGAGLAASLILTTDTFLIEPFFPGVAKRGARKAAAAAAATTKRAEEEASSPETAAPTRAELRRRAARALEDATPALAAEEPLPPLPSAAALPQPVSSSAAATASGAAAKKAARLAAVAAARSLEATHPLAPRPQIVAPPSAPTANAATAAPSAETVASKPRSVVEAAAAEDDDDAVVIEDPKARPRRRRARAEDDDAEGDASAAEAGSSEPDDDADDVALVDDAGAAAETRLEQRELPFKPPRIRDLAAPTRSEGGAVTVINLSRDPKLKGNEKYELPPLTLLAEPHHADLRESDEELHAKAKGLMEALADFGVTAEVEEVVRGPVITRYDLKMERGTRINRVTSLSEDLAMALGAERVRIAQVKGKSALGVEIPNRRRETVWLKEIALAVTEAQQRKIAIPLFLGKDSAGRPVVEDLATMPHLLVAGRTGAGKSVFVNSLILSILMTRYPEEVRLVMIDPKKVELEIYQDIPHLLTRVESDPKKAQAILDWAVQQMEERYALLSCSGVRHLRDYNKMDRAKRTDLLKKHYSDGEIERLPDSLPYVVIIVDELADLMMASGKAVEQSIARLAQKARAVGIHVVVATQRPSVDVITGLIKANMPSRIAFQTKSGIDSRTILDCMGAERLLDKGDMLYSSASGDAPMRAQGPFVSDDEVHAVVDYLRERATPMYTHHLIQVGAGELKGGGEGEEEPEDDRFAEAVETVLETKQASASWLQRHLGLGYARASRIVDRMTELGYISGPNGSKPRDILISLDQWNEMKTKAAGREASAEA